MPLISRLAMWVQPEALKPTTLLRGLNTHLQLSQAGTGLAAAQQALKDAACGCATAVRSAATTGTPEATAADLAEHAAGVVSTTNYAVDAKLAANSRVASWQDPDVSDDPWMPQTVDLVDLDAIQSDLESLPDLYFTPGTLAGIAYINRGQAFLDDVRDYQSLRPDLSLHESALELLPTAALRDDQIHPEARTQWAQLLSGTAGLAQSIRDIPGYLLAGNHGAWAAWEAFSTLSQRFGTHDRALALRVFSKAQNSTGIHSPYIWFAWGHALEVKLGRTLHQLLLDYLKDDENPAYDELEEFFSLNGAPFDWNAAAMPTSDPDENRFMDESYSWLQDREAAVRSFDLKTLVKNGKRLGGPLGLDAVFLLAAYTGLKRITARLRAGATDAEVQAIAKESQDLAEGMTHGAELSRFFSAFGG